MLELICHHQYTWEGLPADKSPYHNDGDGFNTGGAFDGAAPGSGIITFPQPDSRVRIPAGPCWQQLVALKIEVLARVDPMAQRMPVLVAGDGSFRFGLLEGALEAQFAGAGGGGDLVRSTEAFSPDHQSHRVPADKWVKLGFHHDGFARMRLFIDDELVGETVTQGGIPPVQGLGVAIGNDAAVNWRQFPGEIDEVRIWRLDPKAMKREFLGRPYTAEAAECWRVEFEKLFGWMNAHPEQTRTLEQQIGNGSDPVVRSLYLLPDSDQAKLRAILAAFGDLWFAGKLTGPEMEKVLCELIAFLRAAGVDLDAALLSQATLAALAAEAKIDIDSVLRCDPQIAGFLDFLREAGERCGKNPEEAP